MIFTHNVTVISSDIVDVDNNITAMALLLVFLSLSLLLLLLLLLSLLLLIVLLLSLLLLLARVYRKSKRENERWLSCGLGSLCWSLEWLVASTCPLLGEILHFHWLLIKRKAWYKWIVCQWRVEALGRVETIKGFKLWCRVGEILKHENLALNVLIN